MKTYVCEKCPRTVCCVIRMDAAKKLRCPMNKCPAWHLAGQPVKEENDERQMDL